VGDSETSQVSYAGTKEIKPSHIGGNGVSGLYEVATWFVYALAAGMILIVIAAAILAGLALRLLAEFLRELGGNHEEGNVQHGEHGPRAPM